MSNSNCLIQKPSCGLQSGNPVCVKCGLDTRVGGYTSQAAGEMARHHALNNWQEAEAYEQMMRDRLRVEMPEHISTETRVLSTLNKSTLFISLALLFAVCGFYMLEQIRNVKQVEVAVDPSYAMALDKHLDMVQLPLGKYLRGSSDETGRYADEGPVKEVSIKYDLLISRTEVTKKEFNQFVLHTGYITDAEQDATCMGILKSTWQVDRVFNWRNPGFEQADNHPVTCVSWNDVQHYLVWLNNKAFFLNTNPQRYRLPSESEWEYAARAVTSANQQRNGAQHMRYPWGDDANSADHCKFANGADQTAKKQRNFTAVANCEDGFTYTAPVAQFKANTFGLYDMIGNVSEWTQDDYHSSYSHQYVNGSAYSDSVIKSYQVIRGGSWANNPLSLRSSRREADRSERSGTTTGFRIARTL